MTGRALVVRGEPGVGKTLLLDYLAGQARIGGTPTRSSPTRMAAGMPRCSPTGVTHQVQTRGSTAMARYRRLAQQNPAADAACCCWGGRAMNAPEYASSRTALDFVVQSELALQCKVKEAGDE